MLEGKIQKVLFPFFNYRIPSSRWFPGCRSTIVLSLLVHHPPLTFSSWVSLHSSQPPPGSLQFGNFATLTLGFVNMFGGKTGWTESTNQKLFKDICMIRVHSEKVIWTQVRALSQGACLGILQWWCLEGIRGRELVENKVKHLKMMNWYGKDT